MNSFFLLELVTLTEPTLWEQKLWILIPNYDNDYLLQAQPVTKRNAEIVIQVLTMKSPVLPLSTADVKCFQVQTKTHTYWQRLRDLFM